jgi:hypothetical protein
LRKSSGKEPNLKIQEPNKSQILNSKKEHLDQSGLLFKYWRFFGSWDLVLSAFWFLGFGS